MKNELKRFLPMAEGFARLLHPFGEIVVHDLQTDKVEAIFNPISRREVGDSSYLDRIDFTDGDTVIGPYDKMNWDGRKLKCVSIVIRNDRKKAEGFLCINMDISNFQIFQDTIGMFLGNNAKLNEKEQLLFKDDLYERINTFVQNYCHENQVTISSLGRDRKSEVIRLLEAEGAFKAKNAASYVARVLGMSRASVYNYLKNGDE